MNDSSSNEDLSTRIAALSPAKRDILERRLRTKSNSSLATQYLAPNSQLESVLASLWAEVLELERVGIDDNFNTLGGDTPRGVTLLASVKAVLGVDLPFQSLLKEAATVAGMARAIQAIRAHTAAGDRLPDVAQSVRVSTSIPRLERSAAPLSDTQRRMWFLAQLDPQSAAYNVATAHRLTGAVDGDALARALHCVVARHEILRSTYVVVGDEPRQTVHEGGGVDFQVCDLSATPPSSMDEALQRVLITETHRPFDLATGPLVRMRLVKLGGRESVLLRVMHHIASDGWSSGIFDGELSTAYNAYVKAHEPELPPLQIQYADYAVWQRDWLRGRALDQRLGYWKAKLAGLSTLELPTDHPRPPVLSYQGARATFAIPEATSRALKELGRRQRSTPFMTLLAAFQVLLYRYSGEEDIAVGTPIAGRGRTELEGLIGFFANTLVLRSDLSGNPGFRELLARVRATALDAYTHQDLPFEKLVEELARARDLSRNPLFQVSFALQNAAGSTLAFDGMQVNRLPLQTLNSKFDLSLTLRETTEGLQGNWEYCTDLFDAPTIERMAGHFQRLLEGIVADPEQCIGHLSLLSETERHQLLVEWNDTAADYPKDRCIHELIEAQVARNPDSVAVVFKDRQLTYGELNARANRLAHYLIKLGVGPEVLVGICVERSLELMIGLLAILKAGGAYVPLDPSHPQERLAYMLQDAAAPVLLTQRALVAQFPQYHGTVLCLDEDATGIGPHSESNPEVGPGAEGLAYVMYTSGSTGRPKGACITHRGLVNYLTWAVDTYAVASGTSIPVHSSVAFDLTVTSLFAPLLVGRTAALLAEDDGVGTLSGALLDAGADYSLVKVTPAHLDLLAQQMTAAKVTQHPRAMIVGGEQLYAEAVAYWRTHAPAMMLVNEYGPTETVVGCCVYTVTPATPARGPVPIGRPIANTQLYILDGRGEPVPVGVTGELYIGGDGVARGYWRQRELTSERFVSDPFSMVPEARLYRTGDLARYLPDGNIEYLGRIDHQVKIRGFRIELGEIEAVLAEHAAVSQAVVVAREDVPGDKRLVAYVVPVNPPFTEIESLRVFMRERLPDYMLPSAFVVLERLPLGPSAKVDRRLLPAPQYDRAMLANAFIPPRNAIEETVAEVWRAILKVETIGVHDNFFELGGHSLIATQVIARLAALLRIELPLRRLFELPTVAGLAADIEQALNTGQARQTSPIAPVTRTGKLPLSFAQQRLWFLDRLQPGSAAYNVRTVLRLRGTLDLKALERSFDRIVARHESLRTTFASDEGEPSQVIGAAESFVVPVIDLGAMPQAEREMRAGELIEAEASRPFDLEHGPMLRAQLLRIDGDEHVLVLDMHHIVSDAWSAGILERELSAAYNAIANGREPELPALPIQYADYALWQRKWLQGEVLDQQLGYWKEQLKGLSTLELPTDRPRPPLQSQCGARVALGLSPQLTQALKELGRREGATLFMTLLAAFQVLVYRYSGQEDIAVGTPIAGRGRNEVEGLIGFFANTLVLRSDLSGNPGFRELLARVRECALGAYTHQDLPFEKLVEELAPARDLSRNPLFQVMFVLQHGPASALALEGVQVSRMPLEGHTAKFDLSLSVRDSVQGLNASWEFNTDLFDAQTIVRMAGHFQMLLEGIVADPEQRIGNLSLLGAAERHQLLVAWNETAADYPGDRGIHELFEEQVARNPEAVAAVFEDQQLTYGELNARANRLAHHLISVGVGPEVLVGICLERSLELIIGLMAIFKAGGAYVPLDPSYPQERLAFMLKDTQAPVLLTQQALLAQLPHYEGRIVCLDRDWSHISALSQGNPSVAVTSQTLAYVIYTSGSTGLPKGILLPQATLLNLMAWHEQGASEGRVLQFTSISFDVSLQELLHALLSGKTLNIVDGDTRLQPEKLATFIRENAITDLFVPNIVLEYLAQAVVQASSNLPALANVYQAGEALTITPVVQAFFENHPACRLHNHYGPAESHVITAQTLPPSPKSWPYRPAVGSPISNFRIYILDRRREPVPIGVTGELYVAGAGLARGYLNRPELTAEKFLPDPFSGETDARMYRTGDLARYLPDGNIEYIGRTDDQVKIRGYRIELGEIETVLAEHPAVRQAVVIAREDSPGEKRLAAYVVPTDASFSGTEPLRTFLGKRLPPYMVPSVFVVLKSLPLTPNGKVDRRALPAPSAVGTHRVQAPRDQVEQTLCAIWAETLGLERVSLDDNFFEIGGHSLLAAKLFGRLDRVLGRTLPLATLFDAPTIRELARIYRGGTEPAIRSSLVPVTPSGSLPPIFAVPGVGGNVLGYADLTRELGPEQPFFGLQSIGLDGMREPLETIGEMAEQYLREVRQEQPHGPYYLMGACFGSAVAYEMARRLLNAGEEVAFLGLVDPSLLKGKQRQSSVRKPAWLKRGFFFGRFVLNRLRIYHREMRGLGLRERLRFVGKRVQLVGEALQMRDPFRGDRRDFFQSRVTHNNLRAMHSHKLVSLEGSPNVFEIFYSELRFDKLSADARVAWDVLAGTSVVFHKMPGKDSGDMLQGDNAKVVAALLVTRLRDARRAAGLRR